MKKLFVTVCFLFIGFAANAQTFAEWFSQKKTQVKYLTDQIAALQVYIGYVQKGYRIASEGLGTIRDIKNGEFNLHDTFFSSLKSISPAVAKDARIAAIIAMQASIVQRYRKTFSRVQSSDRFSSSQVNYVYAVFNNLLNESSNELTELISLTTSGQLQLTDAERIQRIDRIHRSIQDKYVFSMSFSDETGTMALSKMKETNDINTIGKFYNLK